jgi:hypothetical protein
MLPSRGIACENTTAGISSSFSLSTEQGAKIDTINNALILGLSNISSPSDAILIYAIDNATFRGKRLHRKIPQKSNYTYKLESLYFIVHT